MKALVIFISSVFLMIANPSWGALVYVDIDATGNNDGSSWSDAFNQLYDGIAAAQDGDIIWVSEGTYYPTDNNDVNAYFYLDKDVTIMGGFSGVEINSGQRDLAAHETILSGNIGSQTSIGDNSKTIMKIESPNYSMAISGLSFVGAFSQNESAFIADNCMGVYFNKCKFYENYCENVSVISAVNDSYVRFINSLVHNNTAFELVRIDEDSEFEMGYATVVQNAVARTFYSEGGVFSILNSISYFNSTIFGPYNIEGALNSILQDGALGLDAWFNLFNQDPGFVDAENGDFHLDLNSIAINNGYPEYYGAYYHDIEGMDGNSGGYTDIGCYEYQFGDLIYVDSQANGANDGSSWENAFVSLRDGVDASTENGTVWVAEGTYYPNDNDDQNDPITLADGSSIYGGFTGSEVNYHERDYINHPTIISGNIGNSNSSTDNMIGLVKTSGSSEVIVIDGLILEDSYSDTNGTESDSGAIIINTSTVYVQNCVIRNNAAWVAPCINANTSDLIVSNSLFYDNYSNTNSYILSAGGNGDVVLINCTFVNENNSSSNAIFSQIQTGNFFIINSIIWVEGNMDLISNLFSDVYVFNTITNLEPPTNSTDVINLDPHFTDPSNHDYTINASSPAFNFGNNIYQFGNLDLNKNPRIFEDIIDAGCYEAQSCEQPNDYCQNAQFLPANEVEYFGSTACADNESTVGFCANGGSSVWYRAQAPYDGSMQIYVDRLNDFGTGFIARMSVYEGSCSNLNQILCQELSISSDNGVFTTSELTPGQNYFIRIDDVDDSVSSFLISNLSEPFCLGDANYDQVVNISDIIAVSSNYGCTETCSLGDADHNGLVNITDLLAVSSHFGSNCD